MSKLLDYAGADGHNLLPLKDNIELPAGAFDDKMASIIDRHIQYIKSENKRR